MNILDVNYLAVLVAAVVGMGIGAFWYSPAAFGKQWAAQMGWSESKLKEHAKKMSGSSYAIAFVTQLVMSFVLAQLIANIGVVSLTEAIMLSFWVWLGFIATTFMGSVLWEARSWQFYAINTAYQLVVIVVMSVILTLWV